MIRDITNALRYIGFLLIYLTPGIGFGQAFPTAAGDTEKKDTLSENIDFSFSLPEQYRLDPDTIEFLVEYGDSALDLGIDVSPPACAGRANDWKRGYLHPSCLYRTTGLGVNAGDSVLRGDTLDIVGGDYRWEYWLVASQFDSCRKYSAEDNILACSHDGRHWERPYYVTVAGDTIRCPEPLYESRQFPGGGHLSDPCIEIDESGKLALLFRQNFTRRDINVARWWLTRSENGIYWDVDDTIRVMDDTVCLKGGAFMYLSPTLIYTGHETGKYEIYFVHDTSDCRQKPNAILRLAVDDLYRREAWGHGQYETCRYVARQAGSNPWHIDIIRISDTEYRALVTEHHVGTNSTYLGEGLTFAVSHDGGLSFKASPDYIILPKQAVDSSNWDRRYIYRSSGIPAIIGGNPGYLIYYSVYGGWRGKGTENRYRLGRARVLFHHRPDSIPGNPD